MAVLTATPTDLVSPPYLSLCQKLLGGREQAPTVVKGTSERRGGGREGGTEKVQRTHNRKRARLSRVSLRPESPILRERSKDT